MWYKSYMCCLINHLINLPVCVEAQYLVYRRIRSASCKSFPVVWDKAVQKSWTLHIVLSCYRRTTSIWRHQFFSYSFTRWFRSLLLSLHIDVIVQERRNSSALALELRLSFTNPSIRGLLRTHQGQWRFITSDNITWPRPWYLRLTYKSR